jgi:hypothetical protein
LSFRNGEAVEESAVAGGATVLATSRFLPSVGMTNSRMRGSERLLVSVFFGFQPGGFSGCEWIVDDSTRTKQIVSFPRRYQNAPP